VAEQSWPSAEELARRFHTTYEALAPQFDYETRSRTAWEDVPERNRALMVTTCALLLAWLRDHFDPEVTVAEQWTPEPEAGRLLPAGAPVEWSVRFADGTVMSQIFTEEGARARAAEYTAAVDDPAEPVWRRVGPWQPASSGEQSDRTDWRPVARPVRSRWWLE
jgi:hypothetical protein